MSMINKEELAKEVKSNVTDISKAKEIKPKEMKISQEDYDFLAKMEAQTNQYKIAIADMEMQKMQVFQMIEGVNNKRQAFTEQICEKHGIPPDTVFSIDADLNIVIKA